MISSVGRTASTIDAIPAERVSTEKVSTENNHIQNKQARNIEHQVSKKVSASVSWSRQAILEIDQYPVFAGLGYKSSVDLAKEASQKAHRHAIEYIGKTASDGDRLAAIELGGSPIADIAERDAFQENTLAISTTPLGQPKFDVKYITRYFRADGTVVSTKVDRFI